MARQFDIEKTIQRHREKFPSIFRGLSDAEAVEKIKPYARKDLDWGIYADPTPEEQKIVKQEAIEYDESPGGVSNLLLWNANELFAEADWAKRAYNNSLSGNMYKYVHGKNKYEVEDMPNTWWQDGIGMLLGMLNPVEAALFVGTGGLGSVLGKTATKKAFGKSLNKGLESIYTNKALSKTVKNSLKEKAVRRHLLKEGAIEGAIGLGTFSAASAAIHGYGNQAVEITEGKREEFDDSLIWGDAGKAWISGATLAGITGGLVKSPMAQKFAIASRKASKLQKAGTAVPNKLLIEKLLTNPAMQVALEGQAFTAGQMLEEAALHGTAPSMDSWWRKTFSNTAMIGGMRAGSKAFRVAFTKEPGNDVTRYFNAKKRIYHEGFTGRSTPLGRSEKYIARGEREHVKNIAVLAEKASELESLKELQKTYREQGFEGPQNVLSEIVDRIAQLEYEIIDAASHENVVKVKTKRTAELLEKAVDEDGIVDLSRLTEKERGEFGKTAAEVNTIMLGIYEGLKTEKGQRTAREMFKEILGEYPPEQHEAVIKKLIDNKIDTHLQVSEIFNDGAKRKLDSNGRPLDKKAGKEWDKKQEKERLELERLELERLELERLELEGKEVDGHVKVKKTKEHDLTVGDKNYKENILHPEGKSELFEEGYVWEKVPEKPKGGKHKGKSQQDIENEKVAELAARTGRTPDEIRNTKEYQKLDIMSKTGEMKLDIEAIDRAIKADIKKKLSESQTKDAQTEKDIIEEVKNTDTFIEGSEKKKYREKTDDKDKPYVVKTLNRLINKVKNAGKSISDANKKLINYLIRQPDKIPEELAAGKAQPKTSLAHVGEAIGFAKFLKKKNISLLADPKTLQKEIMSYISMLRTKGLDNNAIRQKMSNLRKFYDLYGKLGEGKNIGFAPDIASFLGDSKRIGLSGKGAGKYEPTVVGGIEKAIKKVSSFLTGIKESITAGTGKNKVTFSPKELQSLIETFYKTGVRPEDIVNLKLDTSGKKPKLVWIEKKKGEAADVAKAVEISEKDAQVYKQYIIDKTGKFNELDAIFPNLQGKSTKTVNEAVRIAFEKSGEKIQKRTRATGDLSDDLKGIQAGRIFRRRKIGELRGDDAKKLSEKLQHKGGPESTEKMRYVEPEDIARPLPTEKEKRTKHKPEEVRFTPEERKARQEFLNKFKKKWNLSDKELKESKLEENVLGTFADGIIKVAKGEWQPSDLFHEQFHKMKEFAKITKNVPLKKLILKATKLAGESKEYKQWLKEGNNKNRGKTKSANIEEFIADIVGGKSDRIVFTKGILPKFNQIMKQIVSRIKTAFGVGNFNDYARILSKRTIKGFDDAGVKYGKTVRQKKIIEKLGLEEEAVSILGKGLRSGMTQVFKKLNIFKGQEGDVSYKSATNSIMKYIVGASNLKDSNGNKISYNIENLKKAPEGVNVETHYQNLKSIEATLKVMQPEAMSRRVKLDKWFETLDKIDRARIRDKNVTDAQQQLMLKSFGVKDGNIWKASQKQLNDYAEVINALSEYKIDKVDHIGKQLIDKHATDERFTTPLGRANIEKRKILYPVYKVFEKAGLTGISKAMKSHFSAEAGHLGLGYDMMIQDIEKGFSSKNGTFEGLGSRGFNKVKDSFFSIDNRGERLIDNLNFLKNNRESLSKADIRRINAAEIFFRKAIKPSFFQLKNKDGSLKGGNLRDYINYKTPEGRAAERYIEFTDYYKNMTKLMLQKNMNEAQYERFMKQGNIKFIEDGIYLSRQTTKKYREFVDLDSKEMQKIISKSMTEITKDLARKEHNTENPTDKQIKSTRENNAEKIRGLALEGLYDANTFSLDKITSKALMKRHTKLPEFITITDKNGKVELIKVYETKFQDTAMRYAIGMSKFLATLEIFPEFANIKGFKSAGIKATLEKFKGTNKAEKEWMIDAFNTRIGIGKSNPFETLTGFMGKYANILAKVGLSSPTTGLKNLITGNVGTMFAFKTQDMVRGFAEILRGETRELAGTGKDSISMSVFEEGKVTEFFDKTFFKTGLMKPTEKFNRNLALLASKYDQKRMFGILESSAKGEKKYERAYDRLLDFYELTPAEIKLVQKHGFNFRNIDKKGFKSTRGFIFERRNHQNALQKMDTMAHVKTQGATAELFMPKWTSSSGIRPATLYKRMAYAATVNTIENVFRAKREGNYSKIIMGGLGTYFGGATLLGVFHHLLGQPMPDENSPFWRHAMTTMWKGEMLGIFSELFSPFNSGVSNTLSPAIYENAVLMGLQLKAVGWDGDKNYKQATGDYFRRTFASYNAVTKVIEKRFNPYNRDMLRMRALYKDFEEDILERPSISVEGTTLSSYKRTLRDAFNLGTEEEFLRAYTILKYAIATDAWKKGVAWNDGIRRMTSTNEAEKYAISQLKDFITGLNPNPASIRKGMERSTMADKMKFRNWLTDRTVDTPKGSDEKKFAGKYPILGKMSGKDLEKRMFQLEDEYKIKMARIKKVAPYYFRKWKDSGEMKKMLDSFSYN